MTRLFLILDHSGFIHIMCDFYIRNRIIKDSKKSNYNWLAPADELLRVCNSSGFNRDYAKDIKVAIVKCYTNLMEGDISKDVIYAYQAMQELKTYESDKEVQKVRENFIREYIYKAIFWVGICNFHETYLDVKEKYVLKKTEELLSNTKTIPSFDELHDEFSKIVEQGKKDGTILFKALDFNRPIIYYIPDDELGIEEEKEYVKISSDTEIEKELGISKIFRKLKKRK